jgi:hypothetical protein
LNQFDADMIISMCIVSISSKKKRQPGTRFRIFRSSLTLKSLTPQGNWAGYALGFGIKKVIADARKSGREEWILGDEARKLWKEAEERVNKEAQNDKNKEAQNDKNSNDHSNDNNSSNSSVGKLNDSNSNTNTNTNTASPKSKSPIWKLESASSSSRLVSPTSSRGSSPKNSKNKRKENEKGTAESKRKENEKGNTEKDPISSDLVAPNEEMEKLIAEVLLRNGICDGIFPQNEKPSVDGILLKEHVKIIEKLGRMFK